MCALFRVAQKKNKKHLSQVALMKILSILTISNFYGMQITVFFFPSAFNWGALILILSLTEKSTMLCYTGFAGTNCWKKIFLQVTPVNF